MEALFGITLNANCCQLGNLCLSGILIIFGLVLTTEAGPVKRSVNVADPCHIGGVGGEAALPNFATVINDLRVGTQGVRQQIIETKNYTSAWIRKLNQEDMIARIDDGNYSFIDPNALDSVASDPSSALLSHWGYLYNLTAMLNYARHDATIRNATVDDNSDESILRNKLDSLEREIDSIICNVYIGLKSQGLTEPTTPEFSVSRTFRRYGEQNKVAYELYRVYILMKDSEMVMGHLNDVYSKM